MVDWLVESVASTDDFLVGNGLVVSDEIVLWYSKSVVSIVIILSFVIELVASSTKINKTDKI